MIVAMIIFTAAFCFACGYVTGECVGSMAEYRLWADEWWRDRRPLAENTQEQP